ncbi:MAG TPA: biotin--[acetyl-CoA-carboxylase] ligase [Acidimicrobiales bacterium]|jgi:BirA family biotin operon repressor/biotin-[acetyl-CoA-carboxylase] ligase|nr:biotin--[acetyl-CoA-carboxylase] ligase [Acidimicrobiales bacterium]
MWAGAWDIRRFAEIDSTNTYVLDQARHGAPEGLVAVAEHQTAGRGRLDRRWESPPGANLLASILLRPGCEADDLHLCSGAVALAAADACAEAAAVEPVLKWPNDLLWRGSKLAGVLAEAEFDGTRLRGVVVGIGLNVAWPGPADAGGTCLDDAGGTAQPVDKGVLLDLMLTELARRRPLLDGAAGRRSLADEVRHRCATLGQRVRVTLPNEELTGVACAIDDAGHLVVETQAGRRQVSAGDVVHLRPE